MNLILALILVQELAHASGQTPRELERRLIDIEGEIRSNAIKDKADRDQAVATVTGKIDAVNPTLERIATQLEKLNENFSQGSAAGPLELTEKILDMAVNSILMLGGGVLLVKNAGSVKSFLNGKKEKE